MFWYECVLPVRGVLLGGGCLNLPASLPPSKAKQRRLRPQGPRTGPPTVSGGATPLRVFGALDRPEGEASHATLGL